MITQPLTQSNQQDKYDGCKVAVSNKANTPWPPPRLLICGDCGGEFVPATGFANEPKPLCTRCAADGDCLRKLQSIIRSRYNIDADGRQQVNVQDEINHKTKGNG
jgi:hypothetical protein